MKLNSFARKLLAAALLLAAAGAAYAVFHFKAKGPASVEAAPDKIYTVKRGDMIIGVLLTGNVNAKNKHKLCLEAPFNTKLLYIVDENAKVSKGDVVAKFETEDLQLKIDDLRLELENTEKELAIANEERSIQESTNDADIRTAADDVVEATDNFNKYWKLQGPKERNAQTVAVDDAKKTKRESKDAYDDAYDDYVSTVFTSQDAEEKAKTKADTAKEKLDSDTIKHNNAIVDLKIFKRYTFPNKLTELKNKLEQAKLGLVKAKVKAASLMAQRDNTIYKADAHKRKVEHDLEKHLSYMPMMQLFAPVDGIITYGDPDRRWGNPEIKIGMDIKRKEVLLTIPDMSKMIVEVNLPEQYRSKVKPGDTVVITPDSIPNLKFSGCVESIASLPVNQIFWDPASPKIYRTTVTLDKDDPRLVSGMSVQVEVVSQTLKDVISVPIEAVFEEGGKFFVYLKAGSKPKTSFVTLGLANDNFVEISSGLKEGEEVYLFRPFQTSKQGN